MQLNPGTENARQVLHQFSKINSSVCGEIENNLVHIISKFYVHQVHGQFVGFNPALTNMERLLLPHHVLLYFLDVFLRSFPEYRFQGIIGAFHLTRSHDHLAKFYAPGRFHDSVVALLDPRVHRVKIIYLASFPKADTYYCRHASCPPFDTIVQRKS